eukprot:CAMPEP_0170773854 /NCGR_PEP_ID=MMETSP0733-20121128/9620_1 /TAXON_ID=186038 /ORGANISM="Fragilariopsis kerguelensis, Strain L26-C5" /LENGTH=56 /DNA_ID=CAMNT_0011116319 /DNA_START=378 /DNA_END=548 /DNA_ORIENTATION=-
MTEFTQGYSLVSKEIEYNLIDEENDDDDNNMKFILNQVIIQMSNNDGMDDEKLNWK